MVEAVVAAAEPAQATRAAEAHAGDAAPATTPAAASTTAASSADSVTRTEAWIKHDNREFYTVTYESVVQPPKATVTLIHGIGEHIDRYDYLMRQFAQAGIRIHGYDQRGFGKTGRRGGTLGDNEGFTKVLNDIEAANKRTRVDGVPHFLYGHSMGGMIVLNYGALRADKDPLAGIICTAPAIEVHKKGRPHPVLRSVVSLVASAVPTVPLQLGLLHEDLTRSEDVIQAYKASEYNIGFASIRTLKSMLNNGNALLKSRYANFKVPLLLAHGTKDEITCPDASQAFFDKLSDDLDKTLVLYEGHLHEIHNEPEKDDMINTGIEWVLKRAV
ncbi:Alpha/Beta hydrolase protein [Thamnocephalis sphaerospora]|uniref:Alpha/Beta hydrolase protein n=1 Tax=Thamnocephalis sphaerospora TaxID=78915 RepID=A0A4P9XIB8_9FUNG|nr:Alpha/Beta hydrolase protein [Thamnocephalis sphaerospora]|eukprot:RKP05101.1 Alpha/Beta hydrolase protein [Thamnocephalis sphaerospora]